MKRFISESKKSNKALVDFVKKQVNVDLEKYHDESDDFRGYFVVDWKSMPKFERQYVEDLAKNKGYIEMLDHGSWGKCLKLNKIKESNEEYPLDEGKGPTKKDYAGAIYDIMKKYDSRFNTKTSRDSWVDMELKGSGAFKPQGLSALRGTFHRLCKEFNVNPNEFIKDEVSESVRKVICVD